MIGRPRIERVAVTCLTCGKVFYERISRQRKYCSHKCHGKATQAKYQAARIRKICLNCEKVFFVSACHVKQKYCCLLCKQRHISRTTAQSRADKMRGIGKDGGALKRTTYIKYRGKHLHRVLMEKKIGRLLVAGEIVHHRDGNRHNNDIDNLVLMTQSMHASIHSKKKSDIYSDNRAYSGDVPRIT